MHVYCTTELIAIYCTYNIKHDFLDLISWRWEWLCVFNGTEYFSNDPRDFKWRTIECKFYGRDALSILRWITMTTSLLECKSSDTEWFCERVRGNQNSLTCDYVWCEGWCCKTETSCSLYGTGLRSLVEKRNRWWWWWFSPDCESQTVSECKPRKF